jgi:hypothetical protein
MSIPPVSQLQQYIADDGRLSLEGMKLLSALVRTIEAQQAKIDDHEARITTLEP